MGFGRAEITILVCEAICILFYGLFTEYRDSSLDTVVGTSRPDTPAYVNGTQQLTPLEQHIQTFMNDKYPLFQDVHVMIFIGFGFLMVFLKNNSWTSIGFNYLIAAWAIQITILFRGFWAQIGNYYFNKNHDWMKINISLYDLFNADFGAAALLITFGAILGKCNIF